MLTGVHFAPCNEHLLLRWLGIAHLIELCRHDMSDILCCFCLATMGLKKVSLALHRLENSLLSKTQYMVCYSKLFVTTESIINMRVEIYHRYQYLAQVYVYVADKEYVHVHFRSRSRLLFLPNEY